MVKVCVCESDCGIVLMDFNPVGMFSHSYALRYPLARMKIIESRYAARFPLSSTNIIKSTIVAESESSREDPEANTSSETAATSRMPKHDISSVPVCTS